MMITVCFLWQKEPSKVFASFEGPGISIDIKCLLPCICKGDDNDCCCGALGWYRICPDSSLHPLVNDKTHLINKTDSPGLTRE